MILTRIDPTSALPKFVVPIQYELEHSLEMDILTTGFFQGGSQNKSSLPFMIGRVSRIYPAWAGFSAPPNRGRNRVRETIGAIEPILEFRQIMLRILGAE